MGLTNWRELWLVTVGDDPPFRHFHPVLACVTVYLIIMCLCYFMYCLAFLLPSMVRSYALDFFATLAFCSYPFGHSVIRQAYGGIGYILMMVPLVLVSVYLFSKGSASPLQYWGSFLTGKTSFWTVMMHIPVQVLSGIAAFKLGGYIYMLDFYSSFASVVEDHRCYTDLKASVLVGFLVETLGVTYDTWLAQQSLSKVKVIDTLLKITNTGVLVNLGVGFTGMYMHPAMASGLTYGCTGTGRWEHLFVYWIGPFLGYYSAIQLNKLVSFPDMLSRKAQLVCGYSDNSKQNEYSHNAIQNMDTSGKAKNLVRRRRHRWY